MVDHLSKLLKRHPALAACSGDIVEAMQMLSNCFEQGGKLLVCGNGGSAADADHIAAELLKSFERRRPVPQRVEDMLGPDLAPHLDGAFPAIPLSSFGAFSTAFQNDRNGTYAFAQLTYALGRSGDALMCISTSGNSPNVLHAARVARRLGMHVLGLTGASGGTLAGEADLCIRVPEVEVAAVQELHMPVYHTICRMLEERFFGSRVVERQAGAQSIRSGK